MSATGRHRRGPVKVSAALHRASSARALTFAMRLRAYAWPAPPVGGSMDAVGQCRLFPTTVSCRSYLCLVYSRVWSPSRSVAYRCRAPARALHVAASPAIIARVTHRVVHNLQMPSDFAIRRASLRICGALRRISPRRFMTSRHHATHSAVRGASCFTANAARLHIMCKTPLARSCTRVRAVPQHICG